MSLRIEHIFINYHESIHESWFVNECRGLLPRLISRRDARHPFENIKAYFTYLYICNYIKKIIIFKIWGRNVFCLWEKMATLPKQLTATFIKKNTNNILMCFTYLYLCEYIKKKIIIFEICGMTLSVFGTKWRPYLDSSLQLFLMQSFESFLILKIKQWGLEHSKEKTHAYNYRLHWYKNKWK